MSQSIPDPAKHSRQGKVLWACVCAAIVIAVAAVFALLYPRSGRDAFENQEMTRDEPPIGRANESESASTARTDANNTSQTDEQAALSGNYTGTIVFPEAEISGDAMLTLEKERFTLQPKEEGRRLAGRIVAKKMDDYIAVELIFDRRAENSGRLSKPTSFAILTKTENTLQELPNLSLRATLTSNGWVIKSAPEEKHPALFVQKNCPPYPYCHQVRRCRPCAP